MAREMNLPDEKTVAKVVKLRGEGMKWGEIAEAIGTTEGKAQYFYMWGTEKQVKPTPEIAAKLRNEQNMSWGRISAKMHITEAQVKKLYEEATPEGQRVDRVGKGGAYPKTGDRPAKAAPAKKAAAPVSKAVGKKVEANPTGAKASKGGGTLFKAKDLKDLPLADLKAALEGSTIQVGRTDGSKSEMIVVKTVQKSENGVVHFINAKTNGSRAIKFDSIVRVGKPKEARPTKAVAKKAAATPAPAAPATPVKAVAKKAVAKKAAASA